MDDWITGSNWEGVEGCCWTDKIKGFTFMRFLVLPDLLANLLRIWNRLYQAGKSIHDSEP